MKNIKYISTMLFVILGALWTSQIQAFEEDLINFENSISKSSDSQSQIPVDSTNFPNFTNEPPIQGLGLHKSITVTRETPNENDPNPLSMFILNEYVSPNAQITTDSGINLFFPATDGILVKESGLYRISYFQLAYTRDQGGSFSISVFLNPGYYQQRYQLFSMPANSFNDIGFSQILRIKAGQKVLIRVQSLEGKVTFSGGNFATSGLVIERIDN